ncbi:hypothetical protein [Actinoplanes sp. NPDC049802]|uniref:hypothetical protein n=1 Tax=Actinoplanes sp. NPDC049802 TaxID=3154742 RepID=UPI0033C3D1E0
MNSALRGPSGRRLTLVAGMVAPGLVAAVADLRGWPTWLLLLGVVPTAVAAGVLAPAGTWRREDEYDRAPVTRMVVAAIVFFGAMHFGARLIVLGVFGRTETAHVSGVDITVDDRHRDRYSRENCYRLTRLDGSPLPGTICRTSGGDDFSVGDDVAVRLEPTGLVAPEAPGRVRYAWIPGGLALAALAGLGWSAWVAGGTPPPEKPLPLWQPTYVRQVARPRRRRVPKAVRKRPPRR